MQYGDNVPNIIILGMTNPNNCSHRIIQTDLGDFSIHLDEVLDASPHGFEESKAAALIILKHQYLTRRDAGRNQNQALGDLVGFVVRI
jgi:hypothetical protein